MTDKLEMPLEQFAEAVANENGRLIRRNEQLVSGPGGIMEMKQTIVDKEKRIEELEYDNKRLLANAKYDAELLVVYHRWCQKHGCAPSSSDLIKGLEMLTGEKKDD